MRRSARATVRTETDAAPACLRARAQVPPVAPVVRTSSIKRTWWPATAAGRRTRNAPATLARRLALVNPAWGGVLLGGSQRPYGNAGVAAQFSRQQIRLIEAALDQPGPMHGHRHNDVKAAVSRDGPREQCSERLRERRDPAVLEQLDKFTQPVLVEPERPGGIKTIQAAAAERAASLLIEGKSLERRATTRARVLSVKRFARGNAKGQTGRVKPRLEERHRYDNCQGREGEKDRTRSSVRNAVR